MWHNTWLNFQSTRIAGIPIDFETVPLDQNVTDDEYEHVLLAIRRNGVALKGI